MSYFDTYKSRVTAHGGSIGEAYKRSTIDVINKMFPNSPFFKQITVENNLVDARVLSGDRWNVKTLLFRPGNSAIIGTRVSIDGGFTWLVTDAVESVIYPKSMIQQCNSNLKWKDQTGTIFKHPCILNNAISLNSFKLDEGKVITLSNGELSAFVNFNQDTKTIREGQRFIFASRAYKVTGLDDITDMIRTSPTPGNELELGLMRVYVKLDVKQSGDDLANDIADNSALYKTTTQSGGVTKW